MDAAERKRLISKAKEQEQIHKAIAEEKRIIMNTPIHYMPTDKSLMKLKKSDAVKIINQRRENIARGVSIINQTVSNVEAPPKEEPIKEEPKTEKPKRKGRPKKVE